MSRHWNLWRRRIWLLLYQRVELSFLALITLLSTLAVLGTGCPEPLTCEDTGCAFTQVCNTDSGLCEQRVSDCRKNAALCSSSEFCNQATGECVSTQQQCGRDQAPCPVGQTCDAEAGVCRPEGICRTDLDCDPGEQCGLTNICEPIQCTSNLDCTQQAGFICVSQVCTPGCQLPDNPCPEGSFCQGSSSSSPGECVDSCNSNQDCNFGYICDTLLAKSTCVQEDPCESDTDCRQDEICQQNQCQAAPCSMDSDCLDGQVCDRARCVGGDCQEDTFSPNHTPEEASLIEDEVEISNLTRCAGRPDWYKLEVQAGEVIDIELIHEAGQDLDLYLLDENLRALALDQGQRTRIALTYEVARAQDIYLYIESTSFESSFYSLKILRSPASTCTEDSFEENDFSSEAFRLSLQDNTPITLALNLCYGDEDWFKLPELQPDQGIGASWSGATDDAVHVDLLTPDGEVFRLPANTFYRQLRVYYAGTYYVRARNVDPTTQQTISLSLTVQSPYTCIDANSYNSPANAFALEEQTPTQLVLCPDGDSWEVDWLKLTPPEEQAPLDLVITSENPESMLDIVLFELPEDPEGEPVLLRRASQTASQRWEMSVVARPDKNLALRLTTTAQPERIISPNFYNVSYIYRDAGN